ncbi:hypothetical protein [Streptomyces sp. NPDC048411]|uniref:hypothetical protein n=1 Tax=Streptomyces sp. NPDC048411 TaxID=3157206 RepID=UPI003454EFC2
MYFTSETTSNGVSERPFTHDGISGLLWSPTGATRRRPLVPLGHGGGPRKRAQGLAAGACCYVTRCGFAVAAIDAPGHGDRQWTEQDEQFVAGIRERMSAGEPIGPLIARHNASPATRADTNPGHHMSIPVFALESSQRFFARHLVRDLDAPQAQH